MPRKKTKLLKIPCPPINKIIEVKRLTDIGFKRLEGKLRRVVKESNSTDLDLISYTSIIVMTLLSNDEKMSLVDYVKDKDKKESQLAMVAIYNAITEYFPTLSIDYICSDLNGFLPPQFDKDKDEDDPDFDPSMFETGLEKEKIRATTKKKNRKPMSLTEDIEFVHGIKDHLSLNIIGQSEAIAAICDSIKLKLVGFTSTVSLFFIGPTGVGKSQIAKLLGERYSGNFFHINCADYAQGHEINRLTGAPPGYVGHREKSVLTEKADISNRWVFLFDEIEKAHDKFFNWLLALMDDGVVHDSLGVELDFTDSIFIFTSNCGIKDIKTDNMGFGLHNIGREAYTEELMKSIKKEFSPEFRNRIDEFVIFNSLTIDDAKKISDLNLKKYPVKRTNELIEYITKHAFSNEFGARELQRFIKKNLALPLANAMLENKVPYDGTFEYEAIVEDDKVEIVNTG